LEEGSKGGRKHAAVELHLTLRSSRRSDRARSQLHHLRRSCYAAGGAQVLFVGGGNLVTPQYAWRWCALLALCLDANPLQYPLICLLITGVLKQIRVKRDLARLNASTEARCLVRIPKTSRLSVGESPKCRTNRRRNTLR